MSTVVMLGIVTAIIVLWTSDANKQSVFQVGDCMQIPQKDKNEFGAPEN